MKTASVDITHFCTPSPWTDNGVKGMGEAGAIGPMAAIASAVADALGTQVWETPLRMSRVARLVAGATPDGVFERWSGLTELADFWTAPKRAAARGKKR